MAIKDILIWAICPRNQKDLQIMKDSYIDNEPTVSFPQSWIFY